MTSENNHDMLLLFFFLILSTVNYLKENNYFGMPEDQVYVMMQDCIPAVKNLDGEIAVDASGHIIKKPHGHGDVHFCLYRVLVWVECEERMGSSRNGSTDMTFTACFSSRTRIRSTSTRCLVSLR